MGRGESHNLFRFLFASLPCLRALGVEAFLLASTSSKREERTTWRVSGLPDLAMLEWFSPSFPVPESFISRTLSGWQLHWGRNPVQPMQHGGRCWHPLAVLYLLSWLQCTNSTEKKQPPTSVFTFARGLLNPCFLQSGSPLFHSTKAHVLPAFSF